MYTIYVIITRFNKIPSDHVAVIYRKYLVFFGCLVYLFNNLNKSKMIMLLLSIISNRDHQCFTVSTGSSFIMLKSAS